MRNDEPWVHKKEKRNFSKPQEIKSQRKISKKVRTYLVVVVFEIEDMGMVRSTYVISSRALGENRKTVSGDQRKNKP
jgi:hypothetical protein